MRDEPTKEQIAKLPKWARSFIDDLERERDRAVSDCDAVRECVSVGGNARLRGRVVVDKYYGTQHARQSAGAFLQLDERSQVSFKLNNGQEITAAIMTHQNDGEFLSLTGDACRLIIYPEVANGVLVGVEN